MIKQLTKDFLEQAEQANTEKRLIEQQIEELERNMVRLQEQLEKVKGKKVELNEQNWIDLILIPFADAISEKINWGYEIIGPFGEESRISIYFIENPDVPAVSQTTKSITVVPKDVYKGQLYYDTGKRKSGVVIKDPFTAGLNGNMNEVLPIPDSLEEVIEIIENNICVK
ncbi:hypothetical protein [Bacillus toyonensis]|uniref:hypothetical protein n=1 Tax=Bacillus toyonensis TaxID=155322 RepID=UPI002E1F67AB|nr:hypothetical protein [Bacillus toyonensis]